MKAMMKIVKKKHGFSLQSKGFNSLKKYLHHKQTKDSRMAHYDNIYNSLLIQKTFEEFVRMTHKLRDIGLKG